MEQDIKDIELFIDFCRAPYNFEHESEEKSYKELSDKIEHLIKAYKELNEVRQAIDVVLNLLEKKDKIIDEIAGEIVEYNLTLDDSDIFQNEEEVKQYFEMKVENGN